MITTIKAKATAHFIAEQAFSPIQKAAVQLRFSGPTPGFRGPPLKTWSGTHLQTNKKAATPMSGCELSNCFQSERGCSGQRAQQAY
jgi:hypothetical protein